MIGRTHQEEAFLIYEKGQVNTGADGMLRSFAKSQANNESLCEVSRSQGEVRSVCFSWGVTQEQ